MKSFLKISLVIAGFVAVTQAIACDPNPLREKYNKMHKESVNEAAQRVGNNFAQASCDPNPLREQYNKMHKETGSEAAQIGNRLA